MKKTLISRLRKEYKTLKAKSSFKSFTKKYNYLNLSVYLSRDERDFDVNNFNLINNYYDYKKNEFKKNRNLDIYFKNFKEYNYTKKTSSLRFLIDFTKFIKTINRYNIYLNYNFFIKNINFVRFKKE